MALFFQALPQQLGHSPLVFYYQNLHVLLFSC
jgi:hypothetical protein